MGFRIFATCGSEKNKMAMKTWMTVLIINDTIYKKFR